MLEKAQEASVAQTSQRAMPDPMMSLLKEKLRRLQSSYGPEKTMRMQCNCGQTWKTLNGLRYNIQQTRSLVSPYVACLSFTEDEFGRFDDGRNFGPWEQDYKITLAFQNNEWVVTDVTPESGGHVDWQSADPNLLQEMQQRLSG